MKEYNDSTPLISIVITTHNRCNLVTRAINSALNQTYKNIEVIIVSDGSTDETEKVISKEFGQNNLVSFFEYHPGKGANYARNFGASKARGEYIAFLDDDDAWHNDKAEKQLEVFANDEQIGLVTAGMHFIYVNNKSESYYVPSIKYDSSKEILMKNIVGGTPAVMMRKKVFDEVRGFDIQLGALQDYDLWLRICQITKIGIVPKPCVDCYDYFDPEKISNNCNRYIEAYQKIEDKSTELYDKFLSKKENKTRVYTFSMLIAKKGLRNSNRKIAVTYAFKALKNKISVGPIAVIFLSIFPYSFVLKLKNKLKA